MATGTQEKSSNPELVDPSWGYTLKRTLAQFTRNQCTDIAAGLTYYAVFALFPGLLAIVSILGVVGQAQSTTNAVLELFEPFLSEEALRPAREILLELTSSNAAGFALVIGIVGALWSASGYVGAFSRAMNRIYSIQEGRPIWKLRPAMLLVTLTIVLIVAATGLMLVVSGPFAEQLGNVIGLGDTTVTVWNIAKWPVMLMLIIVMVGLLYWATPNVKQPRFRLFSGGAIFAIVMLVLATLGFVWYVSGFSNYNRTYGSIAGVIVFLLWIWIANVSLLFGAVLDAELMRRRQLRLGIPAEEVVQLPPRDTAQSEKAQEKYENLVEEGREVREENQEIEADEGGATVRSARGADTSSVNAAAAGDVGRAGVGSQTRKPRERTGSHQYGTRRDDV